MDDMRYDAAVIGAGQAGLAIGRALADQEKRFVILEVPGDPDGHPVQIARELAGSREVHLSIGSRQTRLPQRLLGRDLFWWLTKLALLSKTVDSRLGRRARGRDTLIRFAGASERRRSSASSPECQRCAGLYFLDLSWQHTRGSALLGFVADDAAFIAGRIGGDLDPSTEWSTDPAPQTATISEGAF